MPTNLNPNIQLAGKLMAEEFGVANCEADMGDGSKISTEQFYANQIAAMLAVISKMPYEQKSAISKLFLLKELP